MNVISKNRIVENEFDYMIKNKRQYKLKYKSSVYRYRYLFSYSLKIDQEAYNVRGFAKYGNKNSCHLPGREFSVYTAKLQKPIRITNVFRAVFFRPYFASERINLIRF